MRKLTAGLCALFLIGALATCSSKGTGDGTTTTRASSPEASTTTTEVAKGDGGEVDADGYAAALAIGLSAAEADSGELIVTEDEARCMAPQWVDTIGLDTLADNDVTTDDLESPNFDFPSLGLDDEEGLAMIDAFVDCDVNIYEQILDVLSEGLDETQIACLRGALDEETTRTFLAQALTSEEMSDDLAAQLDAIDTACSLTG